MKIFIKSIAVIFVLSAGTVLFILSHQISGWRAFIVSSGSMEPTISTGSLIVTRYIHPNTLQRGDIITFIEPTKNRQFITHRIANITQNNSLSIIKTKGDHNKNIDDWVVAGGGVVGKEVVSLPVVGYFFSFSQTKVGILLLILLPSLYIIFSELEVIYRFFSKSSILTNHSATTIAVSIVILISICSIQYSNALISGQVVLRINKFTIILPTPTLTPKNECNISLMGNQADSKSSVTCNTSIFTTNTQTKVTSVSNNVNINTNTGESNNSEN